MSASAALLPGAQTSTPGAGPLTLGVLGGGQLGRMFVHAAQTMGYETAVLDPDAESPAGRVSHHHIRCAYQDPQGLAQLAAICSGITTEFENVPADALATLAATRLVAPGRIAGPAHRNRLWPVSGCGRCTSGGGDFCRQGPAGGPSVDRACGRYGWRPERRALLRPRNS